jgi:hypothetical protein
MLSQRHNCRTHSNAEEARQQQLLSPQQEDELVKYIERCTRDSLLPTRSMLNNFATAVTKWEVSDSWVDWFLHHHANKLTTKWTTGIDCDHHLANSQRKYGLYFNLLHSKMREYGVDERNTYNMDEKGFFVGINSRTKRIVSKVIWESTERTAVLRDRNREWVTLLACVCTSEEALPPALIYQGTSRI